MFKRMGLLAGRDEAAQLHNVKGVDVLVLNSAYFMRRVNDTGDDDDGFRRSDQALRRFARRLSQRQRPIVFNVRFTITKLVCISSGISGYVQTKVDKLSIYSIRDQ
jgi:hypothetical protein